MLRVYQDAVLIPYAVEVDNQIINLFDPVVHHKLELDDPDIDPRWVLCRRPCIVVGGELVPSMVELRLDETSGIYAAPSANESQQRHIHHRRLRPSVDVTARSAKSLDSPA